MCKCNITDVGEGPVSYLRRMLTWRPAGITWDEAPPGKKGANQLPFMLEAMYDKHMCMLCKDDRNETTFGKYIRFWLELQWYQWWPVS